MAGAPDYFEAIVESFPKVQVKYYGAIRAAVCKSEEEFALTPNATALEFLRELVCAYGEDLKSEIFDSGKEKSNSLREDLMLTVNEVIIEHENFFALHLKKGDVIGLFPIFPGGG